MGTKDKETEYFSYFRNLYESWEKSTSHALELWLKSPIFNNRMEKAVEKSTEFRSYMQDVMEKTLKYKVLPSSTDIGKIADSLDALKERLAELEEKISELEWGEEPPQRPKAEKVKTKSKSANKERK
ncbi:MAG: hypothetical protein ACT4NX_05615 [Deltaproteobacteria bacterium]